MALNGYVPICSPAPNHHQHRVTEVLLLCSSALLGRSRPRGFIGGRCEVGGNWGITANSSELLRQDMSTCFLVIVVWCCFPCSWTKFNVGLGVWLMSAGKPIGTRSAGRWIVGWVKPSSAGICFGNSCYLELDSIHQAILCFMPSLSTKLCILFIGSVNVPTLPCSHGNLDIQQSQSDLQDSWRQCASSADCFVTILCPSEHFNHLDWEWMCDVCVCTLQGSNDNN